LLRLHEPNAEQEEPKFQVRDANIIEMPPPADPGAMPPRSMHPGGYP
jgi:hypothetical protein